MSLKKLTDTDKEQILTLYRQTAATSSTLAEQFGVSNSTISRLLKTHLGEREYEDLIQQKRLTRFQKRDSQLPMPLMAEAPAVVAAQPPLTETESPAPSRTRRRRSSASRDEAELEILAPSPPVERFTLPAPQKRTPRPAPASPPPPPQDSDLGEIVKDLDDDFEDEELDEELEEDSDDLDEDWGEEDADFAPALAEVVNVQVLPFTAAVLPPSCYLVVDRVAELIVRPLREFAHLGMIPTQEDQQKTLPVFDNHRVARRFSNRTQRVIKVPDSRLLQKTLPQLRDKGITRIFLDGQVYSLDGGG